MKLRPFIFVIITLIFAFVGSATSNFFADRHEKALVEQYLQDPEKKKFAEFILGNLDDLSKNPKRAKKIGATMDMGLQWFNLQENESATRWWRKGLKIEPNNDIGWYNLGNGYLALKKYMQAENAYRTSMKWATNGEIDACLALGEMYRYAYIIKKNAEPDVYLDCLEKHKNNRDLIARLAIYYRDIDDFYNATIYFDKLFSIEPTFEVSEELRALRIRSQQKN